ncbi:MAG: DUF177 domain-containing protein [Eubacterium sp.]|nr:DUF177 domain-containing protein [Eubacterium sp.]
MKVNLTDVFLNEGKILALEVPYEKEVFESQVGSFTIKEKTPVKLKISNIGQSKALVEGQISLTMAMNCARCLKDVDYTFDLELSEEVVSPDNASSQEDDDMNFMDGYHLDVEVLVDNEILLNWPMKILCKESCKGICKMCGKNLNDGDCGCDDFVPDPRMAAIKDIFNANKEV